MNLRRANGSSPDGTGAATVPLARTKAPPQGTLRDADTPPSDDQARFAGGSKARAPEGGTETILLVEDGPRLRAAAASQLRALGYQVQPVGSTAAALSTFRARNFDLLFADIGLVGAMDGRIDPALPVLFTSGNPVASAEAALLAKPYRHQRLATALRDVLASTAPAG